MFFIFIRPMVDQAMSAISGEANKATSLLDGLKSMAAQVPQAWIGDDANEFAADFQRKIVMGMIELIAAIGGININLTRGANVFIPRLPRHGQRARRCLWIDILI